MTLIRHALSTTPQYKVTNVLVVIPVETGIHETEEDNWIPACAKMTDKRTIMGKVGFKSTVR